MRRLPLILVVLAASPTVAQETIETRTEERSLERGIDLDRGPLDHLGWGTAEDLHVDVGLGAAVSAFAGNLVVTLDPFPRGDAVPGARMTLTYNHRDPDGAPELGPGWSWDLGRSWTPGPWGDRILVDADGFRDSFFATDPPSGEELEEMVDDVVSAWRRSTPPAVRARAGGPRALRALLTSDPLVFGEMRLRYLGAPEPTGEDLSYRSSRRGERRMQDDGDEVVLHRADGGTERYGRGGELRRVDARGYPTVEVVRENGRIVGVDVAGARMYRIDTDSQGRLSVVEDAAGRTAELTYAGPRLHRVQLPRGRVALEYDDSGRLVVVRAPEGLVAAEYDPDGGRVRQVAGPGGGADISGLAIEGERVSLRVRTPDGDPVDCSWDGDARTLETIAGDVSRRVVFDPRRPLPVEVEDRGRVTRLTWDAAGRIEQTERGDRTTRWLRDEQGKLTAIVEPSGERATIEVDREGRPHAWSDPGGRRTALQYDQRGALRLVRRAGAGDEGIKRSSGGALLGVDRAGDPDLMLRRDARGLLWSADLPFLGTASLRFDDSGRLTRFEGPSGAGVELQRRRDGAIVGLTDGPTAVTITRDGAGRISGWTGAGSVRISRDPAGRVTGVAGDGAWTVQRDTAGRPTRFTGPDGAVRAVDLQDDLPRSVGRAHGGDLSFDRASDGRVSRVEAAGLGRLDLVRDRSGRVVQVARGVGGWRIARDRSGLPSSITDASGGIAELGRDAGGRVDRLVLPHDVRWSFRHDGGRLREAVGESGAWTLQRRPTGLPSTFTTPDRLRAEVDWDTRGRVAAISSEALGTIEVVYSAAGPSGVGGTPLRWGPDGRLVSWGALDTGALYRRDARGRVAEVGAVTEGPRRRDGDARRLDYDGFRPLQAGDWTAAWSRGALTSLARGDSVWTWERDAAGLIRSLAAPGGAVSLRRGPQGDVRELTVAAGADATWSLRRDSTGRVVAAGLPSGRGWTLLRDALGRPSSWRLDDGAEGELGGEVMYTPRSRVLEISVPDVELLGRYEDRWNRGGDRPRATVGHPVGEVHGPALPEPGADPIGALLGTDDPLGEALLGPGAGLWWASVPLVDGAGRPVLPSPVDGGTALRSTGALRVEQHGVTVAWIRPDDGDRPPDPLDAARADVPVTKAGDAASVTGWWTALGTRPGERARIATGIGADADAWRAPRRARLAESSGRLEVDPAAGTGAFVPPVPGARRQVPNPETSRRVDLVEALVVSGELSPEAAEQRAFLPVAPDAWHIEIVGAAVLRDLALRRAASAEAPWAREATVVGFAPDGNGLSLGRRTRLDRAPSFDLGPAVGRLPPGTEDVVPGARPYIEELSNAPSAGRAGALDRLSDESLGAPAVAASIAADDAALLALRRLAPAPPGPLSGRLAPPVAPEVWRIETPLGVVVHLDRRGRLVSIDTQGRLHRAYGEACTTAAAASLLFDQPPPPPGVEGMPFLPAPGPVLEARWGLAPAEPRFPLDAHGRPASPPDRASVD